MFSRRAYNVEGILCMPVGDGTKSRIWLMVNEDTRLDQMVKQIEKLEDVLNVRRHGAEHVKSSSGWRSFSAKRLVCLAGLGFNAHPCCRLYPSRSEPSAASGCLSGARGLL